MGDTIWWDPDPRSARGLNLQPAQAQAFSNRPQGLLSALSGTIGVAGAIGGFMPGAGPLLGPTLGAASGLLGSGARTQQQNNAFAAQQQALVTGRWVTGRDVQQIDLQQLSGYSGGRGRGGSETVPDAAVGRPVRSAPVSFEDWASSGDGETFGEYLMRRHR